MSVWVRRALALTFAGAASLGVVNYVTRDVIDAKRLAAVQSDANGWAITRACTAQVLDHHGPVSVAQIGARQMQTEMLDCVTRAKAAQISAIKDGGSLSKIFRFDPDAAPVAAGLLLALVWFAARGDRSLMGLGPKNTRLGLGQKHDEPNPNT